MLIKPSTVRPPVRDSEVFQPALRSLHGDLEDLYKIDPDLKFVRAFSWFPNSSVPERLQPLLQAYIRWTSTFLADPRDTIFVTHIIFTFLVVAPSTALLLYRFSWIHAILHTIGLVITIPPFILLLHCTVHKRVTKKDLFPITDLLIMYVIAPLYGQTWNTFYYHHVKHHHVEDNGVNDLSSTIWYDRDNWVHFAIYFSRFYFLVMFELPYHFYTKGQYLAAYHCFTGEFFTYIFYASFFFICSNPLSVMFTWYMAFNFSRIGMMTGNWTQHAFLVQDDPKNDYKTALTCVNTVYNSFCFNDGYHTSHHLNPKRHWQDHPEHFMTSIKRYAEERVHVFQGVDYWEVWCMLMIRDYDGLAKSFVDLTETLTHEEKIEYLKARLKRLTPEQIEKHYGTKKSYGVGNQKPTTILKSEEFDKSK
ncbi:hypothetical protein HDV02_002535 [Globomyces sp. JEL0801]|nr:hypothetical protein HDV02_002535 [Globomyces sp. JEL0801]